VGTVNNLKQCLLPMLSRVTDPGRAKRVREQREAESELFYKPRRTQFSAASDLRNYEPSLSQYARGRVAGPDDLTHFVDFVQLDYDCVMLTKNKLSRGQEFEDEFFAQFEGGVQLPNLLFFGKKDSIFRDEYRLVRVRNRGEKPPLIDFIAYNDRYCFMVEVKSQLSRANKESLTVGFRNWNQVGELLEPSNQSRPENEALWQRMLKLQMLPSVIIKRHDILPNDSTFGWKSIFNIFGIN